MKISLKGLFMIAVLLGGMSLFASGHDEMEGNVRTFNVGDFHSISNSISADLTIRLGEKRHVEASGAGNQLKQLKVYVRDGELIIRRKWALFSFVRLNSVSFTISMPDHDLKSLNLSSSGNADVLGELKSDQTDLRTSSSGSISAGGDVEYLKIVSSSSGDIRFSGVSREVTVRLSSSGEIDLDITALKVMASISSSGDLFIRGEAIETELRLSSGGEFIGTDYATEIADVTISSSADAEMTILKELNASLSSGGNLYYRGDPVIGRLRTSSSGEIIKRD